MISWIQNDFIATSRDVQDAASCVTTQKQEESASASDQQDLAGPESIYTVVHATKSQLLHLLHH